MNQRHLRSMLTVAVTGLLAVTLAGCQGNSAEPEASQPAPTASSPAPTSDSPAPTPTLVFDPKLEVSQGSESFEITDNAGSVVTFKVAYPVAAVTGVDPEIAEKFAAAVAGHQDEVVESAKAYSRITLDECQVTCEREATNAVEHAGVYKEYGTVASTSAYMFGTRDRNAGVHSATMNLKTGELAELSDFMDLGDAQVLGLATAALATTENWTYCTDAAAEYLAGAGAFSPTDEGVLLLWVVNGTNTAQCGVESVTVPWPGAGDSAEAPMQEPAEESTEATKAAAEEQPAPVPAAVVPAAPAAADIDGRWCPTPESAASDGCVAVALPNASYENSALVSQIRHMGEADGGFLFVGDGAPFGTYYPAGVAIDLPSYYAGGDLPEQDRIWNGQTATMMLRAS
ncbi:hypothetical protein ART_2551 [Arthrobacter sp. PAMC 25486]|uniref:hypothetical protein n=1 Tax=Arthrobacter sp. PAMC 25486 TaxID=1494608 RepID=UPI00053602F3|nr:hypothetical protein [Arthrobacter sp. PAMC 25486]AIY02150.1 hypothetical protein ART_2551 [Arthrobacter sp. PAMC 25486]